MLSEITIETALGTETFNYFYVITSTFPQIGRCLKGITSQDFENSQDPITGVDLDGDGYLSQFECDDTNPNINPSAEDIPNNGIDEDCNGMDLLSSTNEILNARVNVYPNPTAHFINIDVDGQLNFRANLYNMEGRIITSKTNPTQIKVETYTAGEYLLEIIDLNTSHKISTKIIIQK